ncbi:TolC family protein [bacterium]|nr:TolC family protein [bacterium]
MVQIRSRPPQNTSSLAYLTFGLVLLALTGSNPASAWQKLYTFQELQRRATVENYGTRAMNERLRSLSHEKSAETARLWPRISSYYRHYQADVTAFDDPLVDRHFWNLRVTQDLGRLLGRKQSHVRQIEAEAKFAELHLEKSRRTALYTFRMDYLDILADRSRVLSYQKLADKYQALLDLNEARYQHQETLLTDVLEVETELSEVQALQNHHKNRLQKQAAFLAEYFGLQPNEIAWDEIPVTPLGVRENDLISAALERNQDIRMSQARAEIEEARSVTSSSSDFRLMPFIGLRGRLDGKAEIPTRPEVGIQVSVPLGLTKKNSHLTQRARAIRSASHWDAKQTAFDVKKEASLALEKHALLGFHISNTQKRIELNQERIRVERSKLKQGVSSLRADPARVLRLEAESIRLKLKKSLYVYDQMKIYYRVLYLSGLSWSEELQPFLAQQQAPAGPEYPTALWLWKPQKLLISKQAKAGFLEFCRNRGITEVFISLNEAMSVALQRGSIVQEFLAQLHKENLRVSALFGEPLWVYPSHRPSLINKIQTLLDFNIMAPKEAQFDAIHLDIEPQSLPQWSEDKEALLAGLVTTVHAVRRAITEYQPEIQLEVDIPTFFNKIDQNALMTLVDLADSITIMAYERKSATKVLNSVREIMYLCQARNKRCVVGLNAKDFDNERTLSALIADLGPMVAKIIRSPRFAIHDYHHYRDLAKR